MRSLDTPSRNSFSAITRFEGEPKMSQNRPEADRVGVAAGLAANENPRDQEVVDLIPATWRLATHGR